MIEIDHQRRLPGALFVDSRLSKLTRLECSSIKLATPFLGFAPVSGSPAFISFRLKGLGKGDITGAKTDQISYSHPGITHFENC